MPTIPIQQLPRSIHIQQAVNQCYHTYLEEILHAIQSHQSTLIECDKILVNYLLIAIRNAKNQRNLPFLMEIIDHRRGNAGPTMNTASKLMNAVGQLAEKIATSDYHNCAFFVPNFDLLVSSDQTQSHLDLTTRDIIATLYENPDLVLVAFKDPALNLPKTILSFFPKHIHILGLERSFLPHLITQQEAKRLHPTHFDPYSLYKYVSGLNVVRLRKILQGLASPHYVDGSGNQILQEIRKITLNDPNAYIPNTRLEEIGGYPKVKKILKNEVLGLLQLLQEKSKTLSNPELKQLEKLMPKNILFYGPPGTGKTLFCKALASELNASIFIVNGPELKSKWVGESERAIRNLFLKARQCAPSLIVFDEIDSFAQQRTPANQNSLSTISKSDHSMLNQLLTEMDGFRDEEMVFVTATTNTPQLLDTALLSRFKHQIHIPYPNAKDREEILQIYNQKYNLQLPHSTIQFIVQETDAWIDQNRWRKFAGRELEALMASLARYALLNGQSPPPLPLIQKEIQRHILTPTTKIHFEDIGGYEEVKQTLKKEILAPLQAARASNSNSHHLLPKGVIFEGPPGTGKTMFAQALAHSLQATITLVHGPELKSRFFGETEQKIRQLFEQARQNAPCVIVFDEIESIAQSREHTTTEASHSIINQILTEMDGLQQNDQILVVATTNYAQLLDKALKRPGRFEYIFTIDYPDSQARKKILEIYNKKYNLQLQPHLIEYLVYRTDNWVDPAEGIRFSGDHLEALCRSIARKQLLQPNWKPTKKELDQLVSQKTQKKLDLTPQEEAVIATHEAGHAIVSLKLKDARPLKRISINSEYEGSLGYVLYKEPTKRYVQNKEELFAEICCLMAGRMAEKKLFGKIATGGANDLQQATLIATHLVASFGMDEEIGSRMVLHPLVHGPMAKNCTTPQLLEKVEKGVEKILKQAEKTALQCIEKHWDEFNQIRETLLKEKVIEFQ